MLAVDTNVIVRLLTGDEPTQATAARKLFAHNQIWISKTVLLETAWVLHSSYRFDAAAVRDALANLAGLHNVAVEDEPSVAAAFDLAAHGIGFADALHVTGRPTGVKFLSFDRSLVRRARRAGAADVSEIVASR